MTLAIFGNSQLGGDNDILSQRAAARCELCPAGPILASIDAADL